MVRENPLDPARLFSGIVESFRGALGVSTIAGKVQSRVSQLMRLAFGLIANSIEP